MAARFVMVAGFEAMIQIKIRSKKALGNRGCDGCLWTEFKFLSSN